MFYLKRNLPTWERVARLGGGALLAAAAAYALPVGALLTVALSSAAILAGTALVGFCPACAMLGRKALPPPP